MPRSRLSSTPSPYPLRSRSGRAGAGGAPRSRPGPRPAHHGIPAYLHRAAFAGRLSMPSTAGTPHRMLRGQRSAPHPAQTRPIRSHPRAWAGCEEWRVARCAWHVYRAPGCRLVSSTLRRPPPRVCVIRTADGRSRARIERADLAHGPRDSHRATLSRRDPLPISILLSELSGSDPRKSQDRGPRSASLARSGTLNRGSVRSAWPAWAPIIRRGRFAGGWLVARRRRSWLTERGAN